MSRAFLIALLTIACKQDTGVVAQKRILTTEQNTFDAGTIAVSDRETMTVYLASTGKAPVTVFDVYLEDPTDTHWVVLDSWQNATTTNEAGEDIEVLEIEGGSESDPTYAPVEISFRPDDEDYYHATLIIESNDSDLVETNPDTGHKIWKVVLRGVARYPCTNIYPTFHDFGKRPAGGYWDSTTTIENCGTVTLTASTYQVTGSASFYSDSVFPIYVLPGSREQLNVAWIPASSASETADVSLITNDPDLSTTIELIGNDCSQSASDTWDADGDGWFSCGGDCDDNDPAINPEAVDGKDDDADEIDNDCDGNTDEGAGLGADNDGDGFTENDGDCWDNDAGVYPGATEVANQVDDDCDDAVDDGTDWYDDDKDGFAERDGDCDDDDATTFPGAEELYDVIDNDCDTNVDEGTYSFDDDEDGYAEVLADGSSADCDDADPWVFPGGTEDCDGVDNDCDDVVDEGDDGTEGGACDFVVERTTVSAPASEGCATGGSSDRSPAGAALALMGLGLALSRARRPRR